MSNTVLSWTNRVFDFPQSVITAGGSPLNLDNLKVGQLSEVATIEAGSEPTGVGDFEITWEAKNAVGDSIEIPLQTFGLLAVRGVQNVDSVINGQIEIRNLANVEVYAGDAVAFALPSTGGFQPHIWLLLEEPVVGHKVIFKIQTQGAALAPHIISIGALWCGPNFATDLGLEENWSCEVVDLGGMGKSKGQQGFPEPGSRYRVIKAQFAAFGRDVAYGDPDTPDIVDAQALMYAIGTSGFAAFFPETRNTGNTAQDSHIIHRLGCYGHFESFGAISKIGADDFSWGGFTFKECM